VGEIISELVGGITPEQWAASPGIGTARAIEPIVTLQVAGHNGEGE
jgi:hypothetical protein